MQIRKIVQPGADFDYVIRVPGQDLTGATASAAVRDELGNGALICQMSCAVYVSADLTESLIVLSLSPTESVLLQPGKFDYAFDVKLTKLNGKVSFYPKVFLSCVTAVAT